MSKNEPLNVQPKHNHPTLYMVPEHLPADWLLMLHSFTFSVKKITHKEM